tara:strand:- start:944 stop:1675 length:732 start_codon:yes stop_codon:yes gene_type:complete
MKLLLENWRGYLAENEDNEIEAVGDQIFKQLIGKLQQTEVEQPEAKEEIDEALGLALVGLALAAPQILEIVGEAINLAVKTGREMTGSEKSRRAATVGRHYRRSVGLPADTAFGNKLLDISKKWHHLYVDPIEGVLCRLAGEFQQRAAAHEPGSIERDDLAMSGIFEAQNKQDGGCDMHEAANKIFHLIVAAFLIFAGVGAFKAFKAAAAAKATSSIAMGTLEAAMAAVKSNELWEFIAGGLH